MRRYVGGGGRAVLYPPPPDPPPPLRIGPDAGSWVVQNVQRLPHPRLQFEGTPWSRGLAKAKQPTLDGEVAEFLRKAVVPRARVRDLSTRSDYCQLQQLPKRLYGEMSRLRAAGACVGPCSYSVAIAALARAGLKRQVVWFWRDMLSQRVTPDTTLYNALIGMHVRDGDTAKVKAILHDMRLHGLRRGPDTEMILLRVAARDPAVEWPKLFRALSGATFRTSATAHAIVAAAAPTVADAFSVLEAARKNGLQPSLKLISSLLPSCSRAKDVGAAQLVAKQLAAVRTKPDATFLNGLMLVAVNAGDFGEVVAVCNRFDEEQVAPNAITYAYFIRACGDVIRNKRLSDVDADEAQVLAERAFAQADRERLATSLHIFGAMASVYAALGDVAGARKLRKKMRHDRIKETSSVTAALRKAGLKDGDP